MKRHSPISRHTRRLLLDLTMRVEWQSMIDIGCGIGCLLELLSKMKPDVHIAGVDISRKAVEIASKRLPKGSFYVLDIEKEVPPGKYDLAVCSEVLEHLDNDYIALKNIHGICSYLAVSVPGGPLTQEGKRIGHKRHYGKEALLATMRQAGFDIIYIREWGFPFSYPLYTWIRGNISDQFKTGHYGLVKRGISTLLYYLFTLNVFNKGNKIFALAVNTNLISTAKNSQA